MIVWKLQTGLDFTEFYFPIEEEKLFFNQFVDDYFDKSKSAKDIWQPLLMQKGEPKKTNDFYEVAGSGILAMGPYGEKIFEEGLGNNIELLRLNTDAGPFDIINIIGYIDCLDKKRSKYTLEKNDLIGDYNYLHFQKELLEGINIFKIPELPYLTFITDLFEETYTSFEARGLVFESDNCIFDF